MPEWWGWGLTLAGWALLCFGLASPGASPEHAGHVRGAVPIVATSNAALHDLSCVLAMMVPLVLPTLRRTAFASLWQRRQQAMVECVVGYLVVWIAIALVLGVLTEGLTAVSSRPLVIGGALLAALLWQRTALKRKALRACHLMLPLAPRGWHADRDCLRLGIAIGANCVINCWPLMTLAAATGRQVIAVLLVFIVLVLERFGRHAFDDAARAFTSEIRYATERRSPSAGAWLPDPS